MEVGDVGEYTVAVPFIIWRSINLFLQALFNFKKIKHNL